MGDIANKGRAQRREDARLASSVFEGLYIKGLSATPELKAKLRAVGYDADRPETEYDPAVMDRCLDACADHLYPGLPRSEAYRKLGASFVAGFKETLIGSVIMAAFPVIGPDRLLARVVKGYGVGQNFGRTTLVPIEPNHYRFELRNQLPDISANFDFTGGVFATILRYAKVEPRVEGRLVDDGFDLDIRW